MLTSVLGGQGIPHLIGICSVTYSRPIPPRARWLSFIVRPSCRLVSFPRRPRSSGLPGHFSSPPPPVINPCPTPLPVGRPLSSFKHPPPVIVPTPRPNKHIPSPPRNPITPQSPRPRARQTGGHLLIARANSGAARRRRARRPSLGALGRAALSRTTRLSLSLSLSLSVSLSLLARFSIA